MKEYSKCIYVKFKPEEVEILHDRMKEAGVQNMSAYIRKMAINGYVIIPEWPDLNRVISLHARISNNLNQYAKKANETGKLYEEDIAEIKMMNNEQTELLKKALEAVQVHGYHLRTSSHSVLQWHNRSFGFDNHHARDRQRRTLQNKQISPIQIEGLG